MRKMYEDTSSLTYNDLADELSGQICSQCPNMEFEHGGEVFSLDLRTITGHVDIPENNFKTQDFNPQGNTFCL